MRSHAEVNRARGGPNSSAAREDGVEAAKPSMVFSRRMLRDLVWGEDWYGDDHVVDVHVANLRKKLGEGRHLVETVRGIGYRLGDDTA